jgi:heme/copper-type cytochrome/quinol oxidase subunit 1
VQAASGAPLPATTTLPAAVVLRESETLEQCGRIRRLLGWLVTVNHKSIAKRYIITTFLMFIAGGLEAAAIRMQLAQPENTLIGPDRYNQIFTMHGTTMMFLFAVPMMNAMGLYFVPLMVGARNVAFPRSTPSATGPIWSAWSFSISRSS